MARPLPLPYYQEDLLFLEVACKWVISGESFTDLSILTVGNQNNSDGSNRYHVLAKSDGTMLQEAGPYVPGATSSLSENDNTLLTGTQYRSKSKTYSPETTHQNYLWNIPPKPTWNQAAIALETGQPHAFYGAGCTNPCPILGNNYVMLELGYQAKNGKSTVLHSRLEAWNFQTNEWEPIGLSAVLYQGWSVERIQYISLEKSKFEDTESQSVLVRGWMGEVPGQQQHAVTADARYYF
jgi:hypothetical protein